MKEETKHIKFKNSQNPNTTFDIAKLQDLFALTGLDHNLEAPHRVEFFILFFIEKGQGQHTIDFTDYSCSKGTLLTIRKDQIHKFCKSKSLEGTLFLFTNDFLVTYLEKVEAEKTLLLFNEQLGLPKLQLNDSEFKSLLQSAERIENEYFKINDEQSMSIIRSELHIMIAQLFRIKAKKEEIQFEKKYLREFVAFQQMVEKNVSQTTRVQHFANEMGISTKTLNTVTQSIVHKTAKQFIDEICTKQIKRLLINTKLSIKEIAYLSGFEETTNFYKYFKRQTQHTPEQFRVSH